MTQQLSQGQQLIAIYDVVGWGTEQESSPYQIQQRAQSPKEPLINTHFERQSL